VKKSIKYLRKNNFNFLKLDGKFLSPVPRKLGELKPNIKCKLFGWGGGPEFPRRHEIEILPPSSCDSRNPRTFCSKFPVNDTSCLAYPGSPVVCSDELSTVDGILIGDTSKCTSANSLEFLSVGDFVEWIEEIEKTSGKDGLQSFLGLILFALIATFSSR
jgi:hypothetical protein